MISQDSIQLNSSLEDTLRFSSGVRAIFQDSRGHYWFGSHSEGVSRYDGHSFEYFTMADGLSDHQVRSISEDQNGVIWLETGHGVSSYQDGAWIDHNKSDNIYTPQEWSKTEGDLWFSGGNREGVYRYDGKALEFLEFHIPEHVTLGNSHLTTDISIGQNGQVWISTYAGVFGYIDGQFSIIDDHSLGKSGPDGYLHVRSILEDSKGRLWIGNNGIGVLLKEGDSIRNFSEEMGLIHFSSNLSGAPSPPGTMEHVFVISEDSKGDIWFGDRDTGAWRYDGQSVKNFTINHDLSSQMIWDIYEDQEGHLLFGMMNGGVYQYDDGHFIRRF